MDIKLVVAPGFDEVFRQEPHEAGAADYFGIGIAQCAIEIGVECSATAIGFVIDDDSRKSRRACPLEAERVRAVGNHGHDLRWEIRVTAGIDEALQIAATAGYQDADALARAHEASPSDPEKLTRGSESPAMSVPIGFTVSP